MLDKFVTISDQVMAYYLMHCHALHCYSLKVSVLRPSQILSYVISHDVIK